MRGFTARTLDRIRRIAHGLRTRPPFAALLLVGVVSYAILHRTPEAFVAESIPIAAFLTFILYSFFVMRWTLFGLPKINVHLFLLPVLYLPAVVVVTTLVYYGAWVVLRDGYMWLQHQSPSRGVFVTLVEVLIIVAGCALFIFRLRARFFFGLAEALTGLVIAARNIPQNADPATWSSEVFLVIITAGVFLVVRGFDNMYIGLKSEHGDAILKSFDESEYGTLARSRRGRDNAS